MFWSWCLFWTNLQVAEFDLFCSACWFTESSKATSWVTSCVELLDHEISWAISWSNAHEIAYELLLTLIRFCITFPWCDLMSCFQRFHMLEYCCLRVAEISCLISAEILNVMSNMCMQNFWEMYSGFGCEDQGSCQQPVKPENLSRKHTRRCGSLQRFGPPSLPNAKWRRSFGSKPTLMDPLGWIEFVYLIDFIIDKLVLASKVQCILCT